MTDVTRRKEKPKGTKARISSTRRSYKNGLWNRTQTKHEEGCPRGFGGGEEGV